MKSLCPNFQWPKGLVSAAFFTAVAGILLSMPSVCAGQSPAPVIPAWYPSEMTAVNLYQSGISQESSNPEAALKTLQLAQEASHDAMLKGGGANQLVLHNDAVIARAVSTAQREASRTSENKPDTETPKSAGNNSVKPRVSRIQVAGIHTTMQPSSRRSIN